MVNIIVFVVSVLVWQYREELIVNIVFIVSVWGGQNRVNFRVALNFGTGQPAKQSN